MDAPEFLRTKAFAAYIGVSAERARVMRVRGTGPPFLRIDGSIIYRRADVDTWLASRLHISTTEYADTTAEPPTP